MPDGRRNSKGDILPSPTATWKPNYSRKQSWNQEDFKRDMMVHDLEKTVPQKDAGRGFTEMEAEKKT